MTAAFADCLHVPCGRCNAEPGDKCRSTINGDPMPGPHWQRITAADKPAGSTT